MDSGVAAKPLDSTNSSMSVLSGEPYFARAAANCPATSAVHALQLARSNSRLVPKRWIIVAGTTPASLATSASVSSTGLRDFITRAAAARISASEVSRGRGDIFIRASLHVARVRITEYLFRFHLTLLNNRLLLLCWAWRLHGNVSCLRSIPVKSKG